LTIFALAPIEELKILSMEGRIEEKSRSVEKFCRNCKKKFFVDTKPDFFKMLDKYNIKQTLKGGPTTKFCGDCTLDFVVANASMDEFL